MKQDKYGMIHTGEKLNGCMTPSSKVTSEHSGTSLGEVLEKKVSAS